MPMFDMQMQEAMSRIELAKARAQADEGLGYERLSRVEENKALAVERIAAAEKDKDVAMLNLVKALKEIDDIDINQIQKLIALSHMVGQRQAVGQDEQVQTQGVV